MNEDDATTTGRRPPRLVKSAERVTDILEFVGVAGAPLAAGDIATGLGLPRSSLYGLVTTLEHKGFLERDLRGRYSLGGRFLSLASSTRHQYDIGRLARAEMLKLSSELQVTCNIGVLDGHNIVYIEKVQDYSHPVRLETHVGASMPAHATAMGKLLIAEMDPEDCQTWLESHEFKGLTARTRTNINDLKVDLQAYRRDGYTVDREEFSEGVTCIAAGVRDLSNTVVAAVSLTAISSRLLASGHTEQQLGQRVQTTARAISDKLGQTKVGVGPEQAR